MGEWPLKTIGDLVTLQRGIDLPDSKRTAGDVPIMGSFGVTGFHNIAACKGPGVTVGRSGASVGTVCFIDKDYWPLNTCLYVKSFHGNDPRFSYYLLSTLNLAAYNSGSAQPSLNRNHIHPVPLRFPDVIEQRAIADILSALDDKIELNRRMNVTLEAMAQTIFRDWFVDFGPVRRKMEGATDPAAILGGSISDPARAAEIAEAFPEALGNAGRPTGWSEGTLADWSDVNTESWSANSHPAQVEYVDLTNTKWGTIETAENMAWTDAPSRARRVVRTFDTIIATTRPGNGSYAYIGRDGYTASTGFAALRPKRKTFSQLVYCAATSRTNILRLSQLADGHGGAYPAVKSIEVLTTPMLNCGIPIAEFFDELILPLREKVEQGKVENRTLAEIRDYLLPRLMSGKVRVADAERMPS